MKGTTFGKIQDIPTKCDIDKSKYYKIPLKIQGLPHQVINFLMNYFKYYKIIVRKYKDYYKSKEQIIYLTKIRIFYSPLSLV